VLDWTDEQLLFSVLIWPSLESNPEEADHIYRQRVIEVKETIAKGAAEKMWGTRFEVDFGLTWDHRRPSRPAADGFAYAPPGEGMGAYEPMHRY